MRAAAAAVTITPSTRATGRVTVPGDKSISHRYAMLAALADGVSTLHHYSQGLDCLATLACLRALGVRVETRGPSVVIEGCGLEGLAAPSEPLDARNSGTTMRLLAGILAAQPFESVLVGDESLSRRPMRRIIEPLSRMGARIDASGGRAPLTIHGRPLRGIVHEPDVPSAQVKSCVLLAGLYADGRTAVREEISTRNHTERALETFGVPVNFEGRLVSVTSGHRLVARELTVPGDISGAAFWCALAAGTPGGDVTIEHVGLNPSRTFFLEVLRRAGAEVTVMPADGLSPEPLGSLRVRQGTFRDVRIDPQEVAALIDEVPALAALAAMMPAGASMTIRGAAELRVKESDRISTLAAGFRAMGSEVDEYEDGFTLRARPLRGNVVVDAAGDHRLAMAFMIAATRAAAPVTIQRAAVEVSYPDFLPTLARILHDDR